MRDASLLIKQLQHVARRQSRLRLWYGLALSWAGAGGVGLGLLALERYSGWASSFAMPLVVGAGLVTALIVSARHARKMADWRGLARQIELRHPDLGGRLLTAVQQQPADRAELNYLQQRVVAEALQHSARNDWAGAIPKSRLVTAHTAHWAALALLAAVAFGLRLPGKPHLLARLPGSGVTVSPGDTSIERGNALVVLARFGGPLPPGVDLVIGQVSGAKRLPLLKSLADPLFGGSVPEVTSNFAYHIEYAGQRSRDFQVTVFEHPRLERADAALTYPAYTGLAPQRIKETRRLSAVEGSRLDLTLTLNEPVNSARLVAKDRKSKSLTLAIATNRPVVTLNQFPLEASQSYELQLVDAEGRTNKVPASFVFEVLKNRTPELRLALPRGDLRPSPLEEIAFEGTVWDDFGVRAYGLGYSVAGQEPKLIELGRDVPGKEKRPFKYVLRLEELGVEPDQLVSWFAWAEDLGPDGQPRRTAGDLYFGEVRPFEEVFREGQGMEGGESGEQGGGGGQERTGKLAELQKQIISATWKLQREHGREPSRRSPRSDPALPDSHSSNRYRPSAPWRPLFASIALPQPFGQSAPPTGADAAADSPSEPATGRNTSTNLPAGSAPSYQDDAAVVRDSQAQALEQAQAALEGQRDSRAAGLWRAATQDMEQALAQLKRSSNSPATLKEALAAEQAAFQALLRLQEHEYQVARSRNRSQRGGSRNQQMQRQLDQLDLNQTENRYEQQRQAQAPQSAPREQLQIMSRLQELARRQQDLNDRLKELQAALQEARTAEERDDVMRRLKRLQEEEQQMLGDVDELRQRMDKPENQSRLAEERRQLEQTREDVQRAAEAADQGAAAQALAAGTRAQRQFQQLRDQMRKENSSRFADDLRDMRAQARELARQQEQLQKAIEDQADTAHKSLIDSPQEKGMREQLDRGLAQQKTLMTNLLDRAAQVSQQAEEAEPLLSRQLYDTVRKFSQDSSRNMKEVQDDLLANGPLTPGLLERLKDGSEVDAVKLATVMDELLRSGFFPQASKAGERAMSGIDQLKLGVERAAESVLGDDTEALRQAQQTLSQLTEQLQREMNQAQGGTRTNRAGGRLPSGAGVDATNQLAQVGQRPGGESAAAESQSQPDQSGSRSAGERDQQSSARGDKNPGSNQSQQAGGGSRPGDQPSAQQAGNEQGGGASGRTTPREQDARDVAGGSRQVGGTDGGAQRRASVDGGEGGGGGRDWNRLLNDDVWRGYGPLTGEDFVRWSDALREVEEMVELPDLRNEVAAARERARLLRQEFKKDRKKPDWAVVRTQVMQPLNEVRERIADELARRGSREALVPLDRDPVPSRYSELVRRYYEELGKQK